MRVEKESVTVDKKKIDRSQFEESAYILKALANETRLCVILQLSQNGECSVTELLEQMECEQSLLSHHLTDMRAKGILRCRKSGKHCYYSLTDQRYVNILNCIKNCCRKTEDRSEKGKMKREKLVAFSTTIIREANNLRAKSKQRRSRTT